MVILRETIIKKRDEYKAVYMESLAMANANHGAMQAMDDLLLELDKDESATPTTDQGGSQ